MNSDFPVLAELRALVIKSSTASREKLTSKIKSLGKIKLALITGLFINNDNARLDMLISGDKIKKKKAENFLSDMESELGKSLRYAIMDTNELKYRLDMYDKFLRDVLESPHEKLINKIGI